LGGGGGGMIEGEGEGDLGRYFILLTQHR